MLRAGGSAIFSRGPLMCMGCPPPLLVASSDGLPESERGVTGGVKPVPCKPPWREWAQILSAHCDFAVTPHTERRPIGALTVSTSPRCPADGAGAAELLSLLKKEPMSGDVPGMPTSRQLRALGERAVSNQSLPKK